MWGTRQQGDSGKTAEADGAGDPEKSRHDSPATSADQPNRVPGEAEEPQGTAIPASNSAQVSALDEKTQQFWRSKLHTANFGGAVALFMRSPAHNHYTLTDLEWLLIPALRLNQFMAAEVKLPDGQAVPAALVLWARVSAEVDARLSAAPRYPIRLHPNEWQSGDVFWIIDAVGERNSVQQCIEALIKTAFQGRQIKMISNAQ